MVEGALLIHSLRIKDKIYMTKDMQPELGHKINAELAQTMSKIISGMAKKGDKIELLSVTEYTIPDSTIYSYFAVNKAPIIELIESAGMNPEHDMLKRIVADSFSILQQNKSLNVGMQMFDEYMKLGSIINNIATILIPDLVGAIGGMVLFEMSNSLMEEERINIGVSQDSPLASTHGIISIITNDGEQHLFSIMKLVKTYGGYVLYTGTPYEVIATAATLLAIRQDRVFISTELLSKDDDKDVVQKTTEELLKVFDDLNIDIRKYDKINIVNIIKAIKMTDHVIKYDAEKTIDLLNETGVEVVDLKINELREAIVEEAKERTMELLLEVV